MPENPPLAPQPAWAELETPLPTNNPNNWSGQDEWKRKTDWCCDGIIASDD